MSGKRFGKLKNRGKNFFQLLDEAYFMVRDFRLELLPVYFLANIPFLAVLMYGIYELNCLRVNDDDVVTWGIIMTLAFAWKCIFQCVYCSKMMRLVASGGDPLSTRQLMLGSGRAFVLISFQLLLVTLIIAAPLVMIVFIPLSILFLPFLYCTTGIVCATDTESGIFKMTGKIFSYLARRPVITFAGSAVLGLISFVIIVNVIAGLILIPIILKKFFDIDTAFSSISSMNAFVSLIFNSTIWSIILCVAWLLLEPIYTAYCLLMVFYGESKKRGLDLLAEVRRFSRSAILILVVSMAIDFAPGSLQAREAHIVIEKKEQAAHIEEQISRTLKKSEFRWRDEYIEDEKDEKNWLSQYISIFFEKLSNWVSKYAKIIGQYLEKIFTFRNSPGGESSKWNIVWGISKYILIALAFAALVYAIFYYLRKRKLMAGTDAGSTLQIMPDLKDENVTADQLEQGEWLKLGNELLEKGDYALALRAFYLGCISALAGRHLLSVAVGKSDYEYLSELRRRGHSEPALITGFSGAIIVFQKVWYGNYPANRTQADELRHKAEEFAHKQGSENGGISNAAQ